MVLGFSIQKLVDNGLTDYDGKTKIKSWSLEQLFITIVFLFVRDSEGDQGNSTISRDAEMETDKFVWVCLKNK